MPFRMNTVARKVHPTLRIPTATPAATTPVTLTTSTAASTTESTASCTASVLRRACRALFRPKPETDDNNNGASRTIYKLHLMSFAELEAARTQEAEIQNTAEFGCASIGAVVLKLESTLKVAKVAQAKLVASHAQESQAHIMVESDLTKSHAKLAVLQHLISIAHKQTNTAHNKLDTFHTEVEVLRHRENYLDPSIIFGIRTISKFTKEASY
ncbi:hypothetical protein BX661DRAFT_218046 [Kickxella alabastrina]|uniref:uncharacterized protein n=1 Tax=Kickxella alabastrina TaxID=61397 RepID=UPI002220EA63|nr:uncharacterized protein BX661DRAFT_218046 [Kickxella alabastrina]KAI7820600.1 hypothetical protein BX661DRAFT_218046 [Kickxella alabastrina]